MPNFIEIGQTSLETGGGVSIGPRTKKFNLFCHGQKRDYLSRDSQCERGTTKNTQKNIVKIQYSTSVIKRLVHCL